MAISLSWSDKAEISFISCLPCLKPDWDEDNCNLVKDKELSREHRFRWLRQGIEDWLESEWWRRRAQRSNSWSLDQSMCVWSRSASCNLEEVELERRIFAEALAQCETEWIYGRNDIRGQRLLLELTFRRACCRHNWRPQQHGRRMSPMIFVMVELVPLKADDEYERLCKRINDYYAVKL